MNTGQEQRGTGGTGVGRYPGRERGWQSSDSPRPLFVRHADALYQACAEAIRAGRIDARSKIGDAVLDYQQYRDEMAAPFKRRRLSMSDPSVSVRCPKCGADVPIPAEWQTPTIPPMVPKLPTLLLLGEIGHECDLAERSLVQKRPTWRVRAWGTAPGEFPERLLREIKVDADSAVHAVTRAQQRLDGMFLQPTIVSVVRINPLSSRDA